MKNLVCVINNKNFASSINVINGEVVRHDVMSHGDIITHIYSLLTEAWNKAIELEASPIYVSEFLFNSLVREDYKYWLLNGRLKNGTVLSTIQMDILKRFHDLKTKTIMAIENIDLYNITAAKKYNLEKEFFCMLTEVVNTRRDWNDMKYKEEKVSVIPQSEEIKINVEGDFKMNDIKISLDKVNVSKGNVARVESSKEQVSLSMPLDFKTSDDEEDLSFIGGLYGDMDFEEPIPMPTSEIKITINDKVETPIEKKETILKECPFTIDKNTTFMGEPVIAETIIEDNSEVTIKVIDEVDVLKAEIAELKKQLAERDAIIKQLKATPPTTIVVQEKVKPVEPKVESKETPQVVGNNAPTFKVNVKSSFAKEEPKNDLIISSDVISSLFSKKRK